MDYLPLIVFALVIAGLLAFAARARRKQAAAQAQMADRIVVGADVMTTSGLHGTVVARNDDDTVMLSIAPGIEVRWEVAALRDLASLPEQFRRSDRDPSGTASEPATGVEAEPDTGSDSR